MPCAPNWSSCWPLFPEDERNVLLWTLRGWKPAEIEAKALVVRRTAARSGHLRNQTTRDEEAGEVDLERGATMNDPRDELEKFKQEFPEVAKILADPTLLGDVEEHVRRTSDPEEIQNTLREVGYEREKLREMRDTAVENILGSEGVSQREPFVRADYFQSLRGVLQTQSLALYTTKRPRVHAREFRAEWVGEEGERYDLCLAIPELDEDSSSERIDDGERIVVSRGRFRCPA